MYLIPLQINWLVIPDKKGTVSSMSNMGTHFAEFTFNLIALKLVNPDNKSPTI